MRPRPSEHPTTTSWSGQRSSFPRATARRILRRDPECQLAWPGCTTESTQADHITGHAEATRQGWEQADIDHIDNGQGVCATCHARKTTLEQADGRKRADEQRKQKQTERHPGLL